MEKEKYTELLSPAKNKETAFAAIDCGADAIYIGAGAFGARQNAANSLEDIKEVVDYAHKFWVKVFVTLNTILTDRELDDAVILAKELDKIGIDAILIQDMGLLKRLSEDGDFTVPIHMSTQCDNRFVEKIKFFERLGVSRVVLARELSLEQIKNISQQCPNIELECFVHGALCVSYSGCYLSYFIGGRSANRGECAQPCRKKYNIIIKDGENSLKERYLTSIYPLCLKDFNASTHIESMINSGVFSFKIEGRLKDVNYVKNITAYYRSELDKYSKKVSSGTSFYKFEPNPEKSFNRGFTDYFFEKRKDCYNFISPKSKGEYIGIVKDVINNKIIINTDKIINPQDGLCYEHSNNLEGFLVNKVEGNVIYPNKKILINKGDKIYRNQDVEFEKKLSEKVNRKIDLKLFVENNIMTIEDEDGICTKYSLPSGEVSQNKEKAKNIFERQLSKTGESDFNITSIKINYDLPFVPVSVINQYRRDCLDAHMQERIKQFLVRRERFKSLNKTDYYLKELDYRANIHNKIAYKFYKECGVDNIKEMSFETKIPDRQIELMRTKHCIKYALGICKSPQNILLEDEKGVHFPLIFDCKNCEMVVMPPNKN